MERFPLFRIFLVASAVAGTLFLVHVAIIEDQHGHSRLQLHESFPILLGGALAGGSVGGAIAAWFFLKVDFRLGDKIKSIDKKLDNHTKELKEEVTNKIIPCINDMNSGLSQRIIDAQTQIGKQIEDRCGDVKDHVTDAQADINKKAEAKSDELKGDIKKVDNKVNQLDQKVDNYIQSQNKDTESSDQQA